MDVQHPAAIRRERARTQLLHVSGQRDHLDSVTLQSLLDGRVEGIRGGMGYVAEMNCRDTRDTRPFQCESAGVVGDNHADLRVERSRTAGVQYRLEVGTGVRREHAQPELSHERRSLVRDNLLGLHNQLVHL